MSNPFLPVLAACLCAVATTQPAVAGFMVGNAPIAHPEGGSNPGQVEIPTPIGTGWWDQGHTGTLQPSGFHWSYAPEGTDFRIMNIENPDNTKILTLTIFAMSDIFQNSGQMFNASLWPTFEGVGAATDIIAASSFQQGESIWVGMVQVAMRPQPSHEYAFFGNLRDRGVLEFVTMVKFAVTCVPEPATWGMMIAGFGMVGAVARRRRTIMAQAPTA